VDRARQLSPALFLGWWAGVVETAGGFYWLIDVMQRFADFPWIGAALVFCCFARRARSFSCCLPPQCSAFAQPQAVPMTLLAPHRHGELRTAGTANVSLRPVDQPGLASAGHPNRRTHRALRASPRC
jgi:hypothetical protein